MSGHQRFEITLSGPLAASVRSLLDDRYEGLVTGTARAGTVIVFDHLDQAGERAVLTLLWDTGHQIASSSRRAGA